MPRELTTFETWTSLPADRRPNPALVRAQWLSTATIKSEHLRSLQGIKDAFTEVWRYEKERRASASGPIGPALRQRAKAYPALRPYLPFLVIEDSVVGHIHAVEQAMEQTRAAIGSAYDEVQKFDPIVSPEEA